MEQKVRVRSINEDGTAIVAHERQSACSGDCHKCSGCGAVKQTMLLTAFNPIHAKPGELVNIRSASGPVLAAAFVLYIVPMILFFAGYLAGDILWQQGALVGFIAFLAGILIAVVYDRLVVKKQKTVYTITGYADAPLQSWENEEDNCD